MEFKYIVTKSGHVRTGFSSLQEAEKYARKIGGRVIDNNVKAF